MTPLTGLVLCGGGSRRMGREKALLEFDGEPLVRRVARRIAEACDPVFLAPGTPGRLGDLGYPEVTDAADRAGPLGGLVAGLDASPHPLVAAVAADMPFASSEVLRLLARLHEKEDAIVPVTESGLEPLHAVWSTNALPVLREALEAGRLGLRDVLSGLHVRQVAEWEWRTTDPPGRFALNVNRPEDLEIPVVRSRES